MKEPAAVIVANGPCTWTTALAALVRRAPTVLAADGGANHLARIGVLPDAVVGDMDSILPATRDWIGENRLIHRPDQDHTDLNKTVDYAFGELEVERLVVLAALAGRVDHEIANLGMLARLHLGRRLLFRGDRLQVLALEGELELRSVAGETWSFWTFDPRVLVSLEGLRWQVTKKPLGVAGAPSTSNLATGENVRVTAEGGAVVVMREMLGD